MKTSGLILALLGFVVGSMFYFAVSFALNKDFGLMGIAVGLAVAIAPMFVSEWGKKPAVVCAIITGLGLIIIKIIIAGAIGNAEQTLPPGFALNENFYKQCMVDSKTLAESHGTIDSATFLRERNYYWYGDDKPKKFNPMGDVRRFDIEWKPNLEKWGNIPPSLEQWKEDVRAPKYEGAGKAERYEEAYSFFNIFTFIASIAAAYVAMFTRKKPINIIRTTKANEDGVHEIK
ncbi:MAG: hypothetical protein V3V10_02885 [Planctomycetota bacterium]